MLNHTKLIALLIMALISASSPSMSSAGAIGKTKNATEAEVKQALINTVKATEDALAALKSHAAEDVVQAHISDARQAVKGVEINRLDVIRTRSSEKLKNARHALNKGEQQQAEGYLNEALHGFQEMQRLLPSPTLQ